MLCQIRHDRNGKKDNERTSKIATEHEIEDEEAVFIVLEGITHIDHEGVVNLSEKHNKLS